MSFARPDSFRPVGQFFAAEVLARLLLAQKLPLRISCIGTASYDADTDMDGCGFEHTVPLGEGPSPEEAMTLAALRVSRGDIRASLDAALRFRPRLAVIQDREGGLVLAGEIRAGIILWQYPVTSDAEARQVVVEASKLRGIAFRSDDPAAVRKLRSRAAILEARLVDPVWRELAAELLALPQAA